MKKIKKFISLLTAVLFIINQSGSSPVSASVGFLSEVKAPSNFRIDLPPDLGTVESLLSGSGPTIVHIQTAHGNYEAQKKIQAILHYLKNTYGIKTLFLEGSASKLNPGLLQFVLDTHLNMEIADRLTRKGWIKGSELFLLEESEAKAYGIENLKEYVANGRAFEAVLTQQEKTKSFLQDMNLQIERLSSPYLNKNLRGFLKRLDDFDTKKIIPLVDWLTYLKGQAKEILELDLTDPRHQIDWPMLLRIFKLQEFETQIDVNAYSEEKDLFLKGIRSVPKETYQEIEKLLSLPLTHNQLPGPETVLVFERMVSLLPASVSFDPYPNVKLFVGHLILQSELKSDRLFEEMNFIVEKISEKLAQTEEERKLLNLFKNFRLLQRLFALELTPEDYEKLLERQKEIHPKNFVPYFLEINRAKRVQDGQFSRLEEIESLFNKAIEFYQWAQKRDHSMIQNLETRLKEIGEGKAIVITGGFHAGPFKDYFQNKGYNYALIAPKISDGEGREAYVQSALKKGFDFLEVSTLEDPYLSDPLLKRNPQRDLQQALATRSEARADLNIETMVNVVLAFLAERSEGVKIDYPLGMTTIAGALDTKFKGSVKITQMHNLMAPDLEPILQKIKEEKPNVLGLSVYFGSLDELEKVMTFVRNLPEKSRPLVVLGSVVATYNIEYLLKQYPEVLIGIGLGEATMDGVVKYVKREIKKESIPNIAYVRDGRIVWNQKTQGIQLGHALIPEDILRASLEDGGQFYAETSRGCVFCCAICDRATFQGSHTWRGYEVGEIIENLEEASRHGVRSVNWVDEDLFTFRENTADRIVELARAIIQAKKEGRISRDMIFTTSISTRHIFDKSLPKDHERRLQALRLMYQAGLKYVYVGIESGSPTQLKRYGKAATVEENEQALKGLEEIGIVTTPGFIMFDPVVTPEEIRKNIAFLRRTGMDSKVTYPLKLYIAMTASPLTKMYLDRGLIDLNSYSHNRSSYSRWYFENEHTALALKIIKDWEDSQSLFFRRIKVAFRSSQYGHVSDKEQRLVRSLIDRQTKMLLDHLEAIISLSSEDFGDSDKVRRVSNEFGIKLINDMVEVLGQIERKEWTIVTEKITDAIYLGLMREVIRLYFMDKEFFAHDAVRKIYELTGKSVSLKGIQDKIDLYVSEERLSQDQTSYKVEEEFKKYRNIPWPELPKEGLRETKIEILEGNASGLPAKIQINPEGFNELTQINYPDNDVSFNFTLNLASVESEKLTFQLIGTRLNREHIEVERKELGVVSINLGQDDSEVVQVKSWFDLPENVKTATQKSYTTLLKKTLKRTPIRDRSEIRAVHSPLQIWDWIKRELESYDPLVADKAGSGGYLPRLYQALRTSLLGLDEKIKKGESNPQVHIPTLRYSDSSDGFPLPSPKRPLKLAWIAGTGSPPNWGHFNIALTAANELSLDAIIWRTQGIIKYKKVPKADQVPPLKRHELAKGLLASFFPLIRYTDLGLHDDHEGQQAMFEWANELADRNQPTELYYIMGSETPERVLHYTREYYQWMKKVGLPKNFKAHFVLIQRGEYGRTLTQAEADQIMAKIAKEYELAYLVSILKVGIQFLSDLMRKGWSEATQGLGDNFKTLKRQGLAPIRAHVIRGPDVDLTIASTYYREAGDAAIVPKMIHDFGVENSYWGNRKDPTGRSMKRVEAFREDVKASLIPDVVKLIEGKHQRKQMNGKRSITRVSIDGASGGGKSTVVDLIAEGLRKKGYTVIVRQLDLFLKPHAERRQIQKYVVGEEVDPTGRIKPGIWTGENSFFDVAQAREMNRRIDKFDQSPDTDSAGRFTVKNAYIRTSNGSETIPDYLWPPEGQGPLKKGVILIDEGKFALDYEIFQVLGFDISSYPRLIRILQWVESVLKIKMLKRFYDLSFRILDKPGRNLALFQMRTRGYRADEEARMNVFYERALQPSFDAYDDRSRAYVGFYLDLSREFFEIIPMSNKSPDDILMKRVIGNRIVTEEEHPEITRRFPVIVIDGRTGVGKTTVAKTLADDLGYVWVEFSWLFRAASWYAGTLDENDWTEVVNKVALQHYDIEIINREAQIFVNERNITSEIYPEAADPLRFLERGSKLAAEPKIQALMQKIFRAKIEELRGKQIPLVISGRTVGRDILPDAPAKFFLTADIDVAAQRYVSNNPQVTLEEAKRGILSRDELDAQRAVSPVTPSHDAIIVDTSKISVKEARRLMLDNLTARSEIRSFEKFAQIIEEEGRNNLISLSEAEKGRQLYDGVTPEVEILFYGSRAKILPLRFEEYGADFLVQVLAELLHQLVYSEKAGRLPPAIESRIAQTFGGGRVSPTARFQNWLQSAASDQGRVLLDSVWLERLIDKSPQALYILLTALQKFQDDRKTRESLVAVVGDEKSIVKSLEQALLRKENGLNWEEKLEAKNFLIPQLKNLIQTISREALSNYVESHNYGVATLGNEFLSELPLGAQFILNPGEVSDRDLVAIAFVIPALLKAAALVRGIKNNPLEQTRILEPYIQRIVPGASPQGRSFIIQLAQYIQQVLINQKLVEASA